MKSQEPHQILFQAVREYILTILGIKTSLTLMEEKMGKFLEYVKAVDQTMMQFKTAIDEEKELIIQAIEAAKNSDNAAIDQAMTELAEKRQSIADAIAGMVSTMPSPTEPTPVPEIPATETGEPESGSVSLPDLIFPEPQPSENTGLVSASGADVDVPVTVAPSPDGVGLDGGFEVSM